MAAASSISTRDPLPHLTVTLYPVLDGFIGHTDVPRHLSNVAEAESKSDSISLTSTAADNLKVQNIVLVDRSMSMGPQVKRLVSRVFPEVLRRLDGDPSAKLTVIGFDDEAVFIQATADQLEKTDLRARGGTVMSSALHMLNDYVQMSHPLPNQEEKINTLASATTASVSSTGAAPDKQPKKKKLDQDNEFSPMNDPLRKVARELGPDDTLEIDVAFIVDCTGSMGGWIESVKRTIFQLVDQVKNECQTVRDAPAKIRIAFVAYRDFGEGSQRFATLDFTEDVNSFHTFVSQQAAPIGGGDGPEDVFGGLHKGLELTWSTSAHTRIALLVADAPCHWHGYGDSAESLAFKDPFKEVDVQERLVRAYSLKNINLSFTRINESTDDMMTKFQSFYYDDKIRKSIKILQLGQKVERFLPSVMGMISAAALGDGTLSRQIPKWADPVSKHLRILVISDGELEDMHATMSAAAQLQASLQDRLVVNAQAVRFFTSADQPDTKGLSSVLQLNSVVPAQLVDVDANLVTDDELVKRLVDLLEQDGLAESFVLTASEKVLQSSPWSSEQSSLSLVKGSNTFWLKRVPDQLVLDGHLPIKIHMADGYFDEETYGRVMGAKIEYFMQQLRVLKVVDNAASSHLLKNVTDYFERLDTFVTQSQVTSLSGGADGGKSLKARLQFLRMQLAKKKTSVAHRMKEIANDERIGKLNSKQAAEYLRNVGATSKSVARRAEKAGLEFDVEVQKELRNIADHIDELTDINDADHTKSFYSQETTLGGIRSLAALYHAERLNVENLSVDDILLMINLVGLACKAPIGDFVDPMTYRIDRLFPSSPISISDVLQATMASPDKKGPTAIEDASQEIINVVPLFDDQRIQVFLKKYAPSLLEYNASVGMRRIVTGIPLTHSYTIAAGVWSMVFALNSAHRKSHQIRHWSHLLETFRVAIGGFFNHVLPYVRKDVPIAGDDGVRMSFYLANNGITNMISPLMTWINEKGGVANCANMGAILRALYTFEIRQAVKRYIKKLVPVEDKFKTDIYAAGVLQKLVGINDHNKAPLPPLFEENPAAPVFPDQPHLDEDELKAIIKEFWYLDHVCLLPAFIDAAQQANPFEAFAKIPVLNDQYCREALQLEEGVSLVEFKLFNIVQAILSPSKASRVDSENEKMKIPDLVDEKRARAQLSAYITKQYQDKYTSDMVLRLKEERAIVVKDMISAMIATDDIELFKKYLMEGVVRGRAKVRIESSSSYGFIDLRDALVDPNRVVAERLVKMSILLLGRDRRNNNQIVWNNGYSLFVADASNYDAAFTGADAAGWADLKREHRLTYTHAYRVSGKPNHHGHSQSKSSFWALGYASLEAMQKDLSASDWAEYQALHTACCGVAINAHKNLKAKRAAIKEMIQRDAEAAAARQQHPISSTGTWASLVSSSSTVQK